MEACFYFVPIYKKEKVEEVARKVRVKVELNHKNDYIELRKELVPVICVVLHFLNLPAMGEVSAMDDGIDVSGLEVLKRGGKVFRRPVAPRTHTLDGSPEVRVAQDAEHEIRGLFRLPSLRRGKKDATGQRSESQRRQRLRQKVSP